LIHRLFVCTFSETHFAIVNRSFECSYCYTLHPLPKRITHVRSHFGATSNTIIQRLRQISQHHDNMAAVATSVVPLLADRPIKNTIVLFDVDGTLTLARQVSIQFPPSAPATLFDHSHIQRDRSALEPSLC
jgi:uncharacterized Fe-S cluster-containing radical SAM superfamily protein